MTFHEVSALHLKLNTFLQASVDPCHDRCKFIMTHFGELERQRSSLEMSFVKYYLEPLGRNDPLKMTIHLNEFVWQTKIEISRINVSKQVLPSLLEE